MHMLQLESVEIADDNKDKGGGEKAADGGGEENKNFIDIDKI
jgi:hypothetical protein